MAWRGITRVGAALRVPLGGALLLALAGCGRTSVEASDAPTVLAEARAASSGAAASALVALPDLPGGAVARSRVTPLAGGAALVTGGLGAAAPGSAGVAPLRASGRVLLFDPTRGRFVELPPLATPRWGHDATLLPGPDGVPGTADDEVLVTGGFDGERLLSSVELVERAGDPARARTVTLGALPQPRSDHRALLVPLGATGGRSWAGDVGVLLLGGFVPRPGLDPVVTSAALVYRVGRADAASPPEGRSVHVSQPGVARYDHAVALLPGPDGVVGTDDDRVLVWGGVGVDSGVGGPLAPLAGGEVYEPTLDRWSRLALSGDRVDSPSARLRDRSAIDLPAAGPRRGHRLVRLVGGAALVVGGDSGGARTSLLIDLDGRAAGVGRGSAGVALATARRDAEVAVLDDGRIVVAGGIDPVSGATLESVEVVSADGLTSVVARGLGSGRVQHALASLGSRALVVGGFVEPELLGRPIASLFLPPR